MATSPVRVAVRGAHHGRPISSIAITYREPAAFDAYELESLMPELAEMPVEPIVVEPDNDPWWRRLAGRFRGVLQTLGRRIRAAVDRLRGLRLPRLRLPRLRRDRDPAEIETVAGVDNVPTTPEEIVVAWLTARQQTLGIEFPEPIFRAAVARAMFEVAVAIAPEPPSVDELLALRFELLLGLVKPELAGVDLQLPNDPRVVTEWAEYQLGWPLLDQIDALVDQAERLQLTQPKE